MNIMNTVVALQALTLAAVIALLIMAIAQNRPKQINDLCAYIRNEAQITPQEWQGVTAQNKALLAYVCNYHGPPGG